MRKKYSYRNKLITALLLLTLLSVLILTQVKAEDTAQIWTDKADYAPGDTVTIYGSGFSPEASVSITVTRPDNSTNEWAVTSDSSGSFTTTYPLDGITGTYTVTATDGTNTATTITFTDASLNLTPASGPVGTSVVAGGGGFDKNAPVTIKFDTAQVATGTSDNNGGFSISFTVPASTLGDHSVTATTSTKTKTATFTVTQPSISLSSSSGQVGTSVTVTGTGFAGGSSITIKFDTAQVATGTSDNNGGFSISFTVPASTAGDHTVTATDAALNSATAAFKTILNKVTVRFTESGLPTGTTWSVTLDSGLPTETTKSSTTTPTTISIEFGNVLEGTHPFTVSSPILDGTGVQYAASPVSGSIDVTHSSTSPLVKSITFTTQYQVSFAVSPAGKGTTSPSVTAYYDDGYVIDPLTASPAAGYAFSGWSVSTTTGTIAIEDTPSASTKATIHGTGTITANFQLATATITFDQIGVGTDFTGTVLTIDGTTYLGVGDLPKTFTWTIGTSHTFAYGSPLDTRSGIQYVWTSTTGLSTAQSGTIIVPSGGGSVTGYYKTQFWIAVTSAHDSPTASQWVDQGGSLTASVTSPTEIVTDDHQWVCTGYSIDSGALTSGTSYTFTSVSKAHTIDFSWKEQFWITVDNGDHGTPSQGSQWVDKGSSFSTSVTSPADVVAGDHQWVCSQTTLSIADVESAQTLTFSWKEQFWIEVNSAHDSPTASQWVDQGGSLTVGVTSPADQVGGTRYRCRGYTLDNNPPVTDGSTSYPFVNVQSAHTITFNWIAQYRLTVASDHDSPDPAIGEHWYDTGNLVSASVSSPADDDGAGTRYRCTGFTGTGSAPSGTDTITSFNIEAPSTLTWNWITQYKLTFDQTGLDSDATGTVVTIGGVAKSFTDLPIADVWYDSGRTYSYEDIVSGGSGKRFVKTSVTGPSSPISTSGTVTGNYKTQYHVTFTQSGLDGTSTGTVLTIDSTTKTEAQLPYSDWFDSTASYSYTATVPSSVSGNRFSLTDVTGSFEPDGTVTGNYHTEYYVTFDQTGLTDATGTVVTIGGSAKTKGDLPLTDWFDQGTTYTYEDVVASLTASKRFKLIDVTGPTSLIGESGTVIGNYKTQWQVKFDQSGLDDTATGTVVTIDSSAKTKTDLPLTDWFDSGTTYSYSLIVSSTTADKQFRLDSVTGPASPIASSGTVIGTYIPQYKVTFSQSGLDNTATGTVVTVAGALKTYIDLPFKTDWLDHGTSLNFGYSDIVDSSVSGRRFKLVSVSHTSPLSVTAPTTVTGTYKAQWKVHVEWSGLGGDASGKVVTVTVDSSSTVKYAGDSFFDEFVDEGKDVSYTYEDIVSSSTTGKRYKLDTVTGTSTYASHTFLSIAAPIKETGTYKTQWYVTFDHTGLDSSASGTVVTVDGSAKTYLNLPFSKWVDDGGTVTYSYESTVLSTTSGKGFRLDSVTGPVSPITVTGKVDVAGNYVVQWLLTVSTRPSGLKDATNNLLPLVSFVSGYDSGDGWYDTGSKVSINPNSPPGYTFYQWSGSASGSTAPLEVTMDSAKDIIAVFTFNLAVETGFKAGDSPSFASDPYLDSIMCVLVKATSGYKLVGTSPGTYDYAIAIKNTGTTTFTSITISATGSSDFVLQSSNPIRVLDATGVDISAQFTVSGTWPAITISSKSTYRGLDGSKSLYVTIHLDYALKGNTFGSQIYSKAYTLKTTIEGKSGPNTGKEDPYGSVAFLSKKATIVYGFVKTSSGQPIQGAKIELYKGNTLVKTDYTDADGFYCFIDGYDGITLTGGTTYTVVCTLPNSPPPMFQDVIAQSLKAVAVNFTKKE